MPTNKELEKRLNELEAKVDSLMVAAQVVAKPGAGDEPWPLKNFPKEWLELPTVWITVNDNAQEKMSYNSVEIPLVKGIPWEVPINIADDLRQKGWA